MHVSHMWATHELYVRRSSPPLRKCYTWGHYRACEPHVSCTWEAPLHLWRNATREGITVHVSHMWGAREYVSCMWGAPLHHWRNATREGITVHVSHTWAVRERLSSTIEGMLHVRALPCMWATRELYVRVSPPPLRKCYMWGHYRACEVHVSTWAVCEGLLSTIEEMLHVRALPCMWSTREPHMSCTWGAPPHHWGNATREGITMHVSHTWAVREGLPPTIEEMLHVRALPCMWATRELYVRGSPPPLRECYTWGHYRACEPHVSCTWGAPLHHWGNATRECPCTWFTCMRTVPTTFQKKSPKNNPSTT